MIKPTKTLDLAQEYNGWINWSVELNANVIKLYTSEINFVCVFSAALTLDTSLTMAPGPLESVTA